MLHREYLEELAELLEEETFPLLLGPTEEEDREPPEKMKNFLREALWDRNPERIAKAAFVANWRAKEENCDWYTVKDFLLRKFVRLAPDYLIWGLGQDELGGDVLYIDLPGSGQISFHVFWDEEDVEIPDYPFQWSEVVNNKNLLDSPRVIWVLGSDEELILGGLAPGEKHNLLVQVGSDPSLAWEEELVYA